MKLEKTQFRPIFGPFGQKPPKQDFFQKIGLPHFLMLRHDNFVQKNQAVPEKNPRQTDKQTKRQTEEGMDDILYYFHFIRPKRKEQ